VIITSTPEILYLFAVKNFANNQTKLNQHLCLSNT
jgi:hypothetical protein